MFLPYEYSMSLRYVAVELWEDVVDPPPEENDSGSDDPTLPAMTLDAAKTLLEVSKPLSPASHRVFKGFDWLIESEWQQRHGASWQHMLECVLHDDAHRKLERHRLVAQQQIHTD